MFFREQNRLGLTAIRYVTRHNYSSAAALPTVLLLKDPI